MFLYFMQGIEKTSCIFQTYVLKWDKDSESRILLKTYFIKIRSLDCGTCEGECPTGAIVAGE